MAFYLRGVHLPHRKHTQGSAAVALTPPDSVTIPMSMHIGKPAIPTVKVGDTVKIGTLIGEPDGFVSVPVYASISGRVSKISDMLTSNGAKTIAVTIESDGLMEEDESISVPVIDSKESLISAIKASGIIGLGGAGFPTYVKFSGNTDNADELIVNGAECEPYITSDSNTMIYRSDDMEYAIELIQKYFDIKKIIIGIENNKKAAIASMKKLAEKNPSIVVKTLPSVYPQGGEKVLVYHTTGKKIPLGKLPLDVGCIVCNCTTLAAMGNYAKTGMPLVKKCVTVDGAAVREPKNVIAPIGTSMQALFDFCGGFKQAPDKVVYGGPMMGITVPDTSAPIMKNTNAILALTSKEMATKEQSACIGCGSCLNICPFGINPAGIARAYKKNDCSAMERLGASLCMECGCCSFVCPAHIPLVQTNKLAKVAIREEKARIAEANKAKEEDKK